MWKTFRRHKNGVRASRWNVSKIPTSRPRFDAWLFSVAMLAGWMYGCTSPEPAEVPGKLPFEGVQLKLLVVDDPELAGAVARFQGEWKAQSGATLEILQCSQAELLERASLGADAVIYPSHCLGQLNQRGLIEPLSREMLADPGLAWPEVFDALRLREVVRDGKVLAVPLGSPVLVCYYRADLFRKFELEPPRTWKEFVELATFFQGRQHSGLETTDDRDWSAVTAPEMDHGNALLLLAWAAPYIKHPDYYSALFDLQSMTPRIDTPPLVRALAEMKSISTMIRQTERSAQATDAFWRGQCAMAIGWASAAKRPAAQEQDSSPQIEAGVCMLPGATEVYHPEEEQWQKRPGGATAVPLLTIAGRVGSVAKESQRASAAVQLLATLCNPQWSTQIASASPATTLFRTSHLAEPRQWTEQAMNQQTARQYAEVVQASLSQQDYLAALPFAGRGEYLAALDKAVEQALTGDASPAEALAACSQQWSEITEQLGRRQQQEAYRRAVEFGP